MLQAAYSHHALTAVHPFADGNGRVARLVASIWLLRRVSVPLWVETTDRDRYLDVLSAADRGDHQPLLRFVGAVSLRLLRELALVFEQPPDPRPPLTSQDEAEEEGARAMAEVVVEEVRAALTWEQASMVDHPAPMPPPEVDGVRVPRAGSVAFNVRGSVIDRGARLVAAGVASRAKPDDRFRVLVFDKVINGALIRTEHLGRDEVLPVLSPPARRRLTLLARLLAEESGSERRD